MTVRSFFKSCGLLLLFSGVAMGIYTSASSMLATFESMSHNGGNIDPAELSERVSKSLSTTSIGISIAFAGLAILLCCFLIKEKASTEPSAADEDSAQA